MNRTLKTALSSVAILGLAVSTMGAEGGGCGAADPDAPVAPDLAGSWAVDYDDVLGVVIKIGGATYTAEVGAQGGDVTIDHEGRPFTFQLACEREEVLCPSEVWPETVTLEQPDETRTQNVRVTLPSQECDGTLVEADRATCGAGTRNPDCEQVCEGTVVVREALRPGLVTQDGRKLSILLGIGATSNGVNCLLLGASVAEASITSSGEPNTVDWRAESLDAGRVVTGYSGGCLWAGDPDGDEELEALVLAASVTFETGFTATPSGR